MTDRMLSGRRMVIVEDDYYQAQDTKEMLERAGAKVIAASAVVPDLAALLAEGRIDAALLDINLGNSLSLDFARALRDRGVPFAFLTGYDARMLPDDLADSACISKPSRQCAGARDARRDQPGKGIGRAGSIPSGGQRSGCSRKSVEEQADLGARREIGAVEPGDLLQFAQIEDRELLRAQRDQTLLPQLLKLAIDVHGSEPEHVGQIILRQREKELLVLDPFDQRETEIAFAQQVRHPLERVAATDIDHPRGKHGILHAAIAAHRFADRGEAIDGALHIGVEDVDDPARAQCHHLFDCGAIGRRIEIEGIARKQQAGDLARAVAQDLVARGPTAQNDRERDDLVPVARQILLGGDVTRLAAELLERFDLLRPQLGGVHQSLQKGVGHVRAPSIRGRIHCHPSTDITLTQKL
jgi:CheY-like chemotaxis protein